MYGLGNFCSELTESVNFLGKKTNDEEIDKIIIPLLAIKHAIHMVKKETERPLRNKQTVLHLQNRLQRKFEGSGQKIEECLGRVIDSLSEDGLIYMQEKRIYLNNSNPNTRASVIRRMQSTDYLLTICGIYNHPVYGEIFKDG